MYRLVCLLLGILLVLGCDSDLHRVQDSGPDADVPDTTDVIDVQDVSDVPDQTDTADASGYPDGWPAPSCDEDPTQTLVAAGDRIVTAAYYPYIYISQYDYSDRRSTVYSFHVETQELRELFSIVPETLTKILVHPEDQSLWISGIEAWNYDNPVDRDPPRLFRWDITAETLEDLTSQLPNLRSPACEVNMANLTLQMIDLDRNRLLLHCDFPLDDTVHGELYFYDLATSEKVFLGPGAAVPQNLDLVGGVRCRNLVRILVAGESDGASFFNGSRHDDSSPGDLSGQFWSLRFGLFSPR